MARKRFMAELMELAQAPGAFSASVLGHTQAATKGVENEEDAPSKIDRARSMMKSLITDEDFDRQEVLQNLMAALDVTESTATSYFQRIAKEMGLTNLGDGDDEGGGGKMTAGDQGGEMSAGAPADMAGGRGSEFDNEIPEEEPEEIPESDDPNRQGIIRVVANAHLIYKRQNEEGGYDELWIYNTAEGVKTDLEVRRDILAGTDIQPKKTRSEDGTQEYRLSNMGNAQILEITGLPQ